MTVESPEGETYTHGCHDAAGRDLWGEMWAVRVVDSDFADHAVNRGLATRSELEEISAAFSRWAASRAGFWAYLNGEVLAVRPPVCVS